MKIMIRSIKLYLLLIFLVSFSAFFWGHGKGVCFEKNIVSSISVSIGKIKIHSSPTHDKDNDGFYSRATIEFSVIPTGKIVGNVNRKILIDKVEISYVKSSSSALIHHSNISINKYVQFGKSKNFRFVVNNLEQNSYSFVISPYFGPFGKYKGASRTSPSVNIETYKQDKRKKKITTSGSEFSEDLTKYDYTLLPSDDENNDSFLEWCMDQSISKSEQRTLQVLIARLGKRKRATIANADCYKKHEALHIYLSNFKGRRILIKKAYSTGKKPHRKFHDAVYGYDGNLLLTNYQISDPAPLNILDKYSNIKSVTIWLHPEGDATCPCERVECKFVIRPVN